MGAVTRDYGTLLFSDPAFDTADKRYFPDNAIGAAILSDADFRSGKCIRFNSAANTERVRYHLDSMPTDGSDYIELAYGEQVRYFFEYDGAKTGTANRVSIFEAAGGSVQLLIKLESGGSYTLRVSITDRNGGGPTTHDISSFPIGAGVVRDMEVGIRRWLDGADTKVEVIVRWDGVQQAVVNHTITGADKTVRVHSFWIGHTADSEKAVTCDHRHGRVHVSYNNGTISRADQQWYTEWEPSVLQQLPTSDVTSPDEWTGQGDTANLYANVDDNPSSFSTGNYTSNSTSKFELLMGFAAVGSLPNIAAVICLYNARLSAGAPVGNPTHQVIAKNGAGTYKRRPQHTAESGTQLNDGIIMAGVFLTDPANAAWTSSSVDDNDFGLDKPATGSASGGSVGEFWRYVLYGGAQLAAPAARSAPVLMSPGGMGVV